MPLKHRWDDYDPYSLFSEPPVDIVLLLSKISNRGKFAFAIGCAEWVVYRFKDFSDDPRPLQFIEACWAVEMSSKFESPDESEDEEWEGPIRGPIDLALMTILNTFYASEDGNAEEDAAFAAMIPPHVLPDPEVFLVWRDQVLSNLAATYPYSTQDPLGDPIPRESLDITITLDEVQRIALVKTYLLTLPKKGNPFLMRADD
jgi:hypothetical protein